MKYPEVPHINKYAQPTIELVLSLLEQAYQDEYKLDRILKELSDDVLRELVKELKVLEKNGFSLQSRAEQIPMNVFIEISNNI